MSSTLVERQIDCTDYIDCCYDDDYGDSFDCTIDDDCYVDNGSVDVDYYDSDAGVVDDAGNIVDGYSRQALRCLPSCLGSA